MESEQKSKTGRWLLILVIILALLIHIGGLILFLSWKYDTSFFQSTPPVTTHIIDPQTFITYPDAPQPDAQADLSDLPAQLKARNSTFGLPDAQPQPPMQTDEQKTQERPQQEPEERSAQQEDETALDEQEQAAPDLQAHEKQDIAQQETPEQETGQTTIETAQPEQIAEQQIVKKKRKKKKKAASQQSYSSPEVSGQQPLTFAQLAQGFLDTLSEDGQDWFSRKGDPNKRPDFEELKRLSYMQKVAWYLQQAWRANPPQSKRPLLSDVVVCVHMIIDKEGHLADLIVMQYSGIAEIDDAIVQGIKTAAPFPPLPKHLNTNQLDIKFGIHVAAEPIQRKSAATAQRRKTIL